MTYPPPDDRLRHLIAQQINPSVDSWKLAFFLADSIVTSPEILAELDRVATVHAAGQPCGDRQCRRCFEAAAGIRDAARTASGQQPEQPAPAVGQPAEAHGTGQHRPPCTNGNHCGEPSHCPPIPAYERLQAIAAKTNRDMAGATLRAYKRIYQLAHNATGPIQPADILDALKDPAPDPAKLLAAITVEAQPADRAAILCEAAAFIERLQDQMDEEIRAEYSELDRDTEVEGAATRRMANELRQMAEEAR
ncbi:hypothetical protein [Streptomyces gardneri]|uniref:hypothetical protein n=1 Tax=Streptomyces gardneri TaxID=66892 RepID=UPI0035D6651F